MATVPTLAETFATNVFMYNGTSSQRAKIDLAEQKLREVIHTKEFKNRVINFTYNGTKRFVDNKGLTNTQIYYKILNAAEKLLPVIDNELDLNIKTYYSSSSTVGYTSSNINYINFNTKYLKSYSLSETAKTMMHEWLHKLGFGHAYSYSTSRNYSVPYGIGKIMMELAAKI
jgi:3-oxoacyl-[acyl-carrier-protein] synthase III